MLEFPPDEAASLEQFKMRQEAASSLFLGAFIPSSSPRDKRLIIGYVCATRSALPSLTQESMKMHDTEGPSVCIHAVVVASQYKRRGIALALLKEFVTRLGSDSLTKRALLICHDDVRPFYEKAGFEYVGHSAVVHGVLPWHEMRIVFDNLPNYARRQDSRNSAPSSSVDTASAPASGSLPPGLLEALQQSGSSRNRPSARLLSSFTGGIHDAIDESEAGKANKYHLLCPRAGCGSVILKAGVGRFLERELPQVQYLPFYPCHFFSNFISDTFS